MPLSEETKRRIIAEALAKEAGRDPKAPPTLLGFPVVEVDDLPHVGEITLGGDVIHPGLVDILLGRKLSAITKAVIDEHGGFANPGFTPAHLLRGLLLPDVDESPEDEE